MSTLGSLYIKRGEPEGELCGCTCEVGDWAAQEILRLDALKAELLEALRAIDRMLDNESTDFALMGEVIHHAITKATQGETK